MADIEFINPNSHPIQVKGGDGKTVTFASMQRRVLPEHFRKYCPRYLAVANSSKLPRSVKSISRGNRLTRQQSVTQKRVERRRKLDRRGAKVQSPSPPTKVSEAKPRRRLVRKGEKVRKTVGTKQHRNSFEATKFFKQLLEKSRYPLSNGVGVGILSYNRLHCIKRLIRSIERHTNLNQTTVFVSDESDNDDVKRWLSDLKSVSVIDNKERLGIAGNTNRLLRCLDRFKYKILLNDDVEVLREGWDRVYPAMMNQTDYHHFCMRQPGIFGAKQWEGTIKELGEFAIQTVDKKPHGAVIAFDDKAFETVGYFDESFGLYGMEHVDWSNRVSLSGIQPSGFHDVVGSEQFFKIHAEQSSINTIDRVKTWKEAKQKFEKIRNNKSRIYVKPSEKSAVPEVTYIVPFRGKERRKAVDTVIANIKAQRFPRIEIIIVEHSNEQQARFDCFGSIRYFLATEKPGPFAKSIAVNKGAAAASCDKIIIHDADMLVTADYTRKVTQKLTNHDSCHIGKYVVYMDKHSTGLIVKRQNVTKKMTAKMSVNYFEGGSLACTKKAFFDIGGFYEGFLGYGCEDCEFFERLSNLTNMFNMRGETFLHLEHERTSGWQRLHAKNKRTHARLKAKSWDYRRNISIDLLKKSGYGKVIRKLGINSA